MLNRRSMPFSALRAFESAGEFLHMGRAGESLGVTHGAISHQIRVLEERLGVRLFFRGNRGLQLTPAGERLLGSVQQGLDHIVASASSLNPESLTGSLTIGCTQTIGASWAVKHIMDFQARFPETTVHVVELEALQRDIPRDIDISICYGEPVSSGRRLEKLVTPAIFPVCNPGLLYGEVRVEKPVQLLEFPLLHDAQLKWKDWFAEMGVDITENTRNTYFTSTNLTLNAARNGYGIALGNPFEIQQDLKDGRLVKIIERSISEPHSYYMLTNPVVEQTQRARLFEASFKRILFASINT